MKSCFKLPPSLRSGDTIAIISPASAIATELVEGAIPVLQQQGWRVKVMPSALGCHGSYSAEASMRMADLRMAITDPEVKAIMCSRGGYGTVHLLDGFPSAELASNPKWLIGFSDISALHAAALHSGVASIHGSMCKHLALHGADNEPSQRLFALLNGQTPAPYSCPVHHHNRQGQATGTLVGGNMAVIGGLIGTPFDIFATTPDPIIFIEDIAEPIYKVERMLYQLQLNGTLARARGLIVGSFTETGPDRNHADMTDMIAQFTANLDTPVAYDFAVGHIDSNLPLVEGATVSLSVDSGGSTLTY